MTLESRGAEAPALLHRIGSQCMSAAPASSFAAEYTARVDVTARRRLPVAIFSLDTRPLPGKTYAPIDRRPLTAGNGIDDPMGILRDDILAHDDPSPATDGDPDVTRCLLSGSIR